MSTSRILLAGLAYSGLVLAISLSFWLLRIVLILPYLGRGMAAFELILLLVLFYCAARFIARRFGPAGRKEWFQVGAIAALTLVVAELAAWLLIFRAPLGTILREKTSITGLLAFFAQSLLIVFPALAAGWDRTRS